MGWLTRWENKCNRSLVGYISLYCNLCKVYLSLLGKESPTSSILLREAQDGEMRFIGNKF